MQGTCWWQDLLQLKSPWWCWAGGTLLCAQHLHGCLWPHTINNRASSIRPKVPRTDQPSFQLSSRWPRKKQIHSLIQEEEWLAGCRNASQWCPNPSVLRTTRQASHPSALHRETPKSKLKAQVVAMPNCKVKSPHHTMLQPKVVREGQPKEQPKVVGWDFL